jgi:hypothetical protein
MYLQNWVITQWVLSHTYFSRVKFLFLEELISHKAPFFYNFYQKKLDTCFLCDTVISNA